MSTEKKKIAKQTAPSENKHTSAAGFTLTEVMVSFAIFFIVLLGVLASFTYAVNYNAGNSSRAQALALLQQKVEVMRSKKYTPGFTDTDLLGGTKTPQTVTGSDGFNYVIKVDVDNDPFTAGIQGETTSTTMKEVSVTIILDRPTPGWQTSVPATVVLRRTRAN